MFSVTKAGEEAGSGETFFRVGAALQPGRLRSFAVTASRCASESPQTCVSLASNFLYRWEAATITRTVGIVQIKLAGRLQLLQISKLIKIFNSLSLNTQPKLK